MPSAPKAWRRSSPGFDASRVPYRVAVVPELDLRQVHVRDPDGNHVEISFAAEEVADLSPYDGTDERTAQATMTEP